MLALQTLQKIDRRLLHWSPPPDLLLVYDADLQSNTVQCFDDPSYACICAATAHLAP